MWIITSKIKSHSIEGELIMFINIRVLRLRSTDWKSSLRKERESSWSEDRYKNILTVHCNRLLGQ